MAVNLSCFNKTGNKKQLRNSHLCKHIFQPSTPLAASGRPARGRKSCRKGEIVEKCVKAKAHKII